jgi:hypothetical protein
VCLALNPCFADVANFPDTTRARLRWPWLAYGLES